MLHDITHAHLNIHSHSEPYALCVCVFISVLTRMEMQWKPIEAFESRSLAVQYNSNGVTYELYLLHFNAIC